MAAYAFKAINSAGVETAGGELHAPDDASAREQLRIPWPAGHKKAGGGPTRVGEVLRARTPAAFKKVKPKSLQIFSRQFATMIEAGLNVVSALVILEQQTDDVYLEAVGDSPTSAETSRAGCFSRSRWARHPRCSTRLYVSMVEAGEAAGILDIVLDRVAFQIEKEAADQAPCQGRDDLPDDGADLRHSRVERHAPSSSSRSS